MDDAALDAAMRAFDAAFNHTLRPTGCRVAFNDQERAAMDTLGPLLRQRDPPLIITDKEREAMLALRERLAEHSLDETDATYCTDSCLVRYLRARSLDLDKAEKLLLSSLRWRREAPVPTECEACGVSTKAHCMRMVGVCRENGPVIYTDFRHATQRGHPSGTQHITLVLEKAFEATRYMGLQSTLATIVILFEGFGFSDMDPRLASQVLRILGDHYPERLRRVVLVDAPYIFQPVWKAIKGLLPAETSHKIAFSSSGPGLAEAFEKYFDPTVRTLLVDQIAADKAPSSS